jgi:hypothetical protein
MKKRGEPMSASRFKFSSLRRLLSDLGFKEVVANTDKPHVAFQHDPSDLLIVLPPYRNNAAVAPHHLVYVRMMLDGKGLMDADKFDRLVGNVPTPRSA